MRRLAGAGERYAAGGALDLTRADQRRVGALIEALIALLDEAAGDPDLEDGDLDRCTAGEDGPRSDPAFDAGWRNAA
jgi:hypothetical protein